MTDSHHSHHIHLSQSQTTSGFVGSVAAPHAQNRAAHGNVCVTEHCACGYQRHTLVNQHHRERGDWHAGPELERRWAAERTEREAQAAAATERRDRAAAVRRGASSWTSDDGVRLRVLEAACDGVTLDLRRADSTRSVMRLDWDLLRESARQDDARLAAAYGAALHDAELLVD